MDVGERIKRLESCLRQAASMAFEQVRRSHEGEHFYAFALVTGGDASFILPAANTEEALRQRFGARAEPDQEPWLRWNPAEWGYLEEGREHFPEVQEVLDQFDPYDRRVPLQEREAHIQRIFDACIRVLRDLDEQGAFGAGSVREAGVVSLLKDDQSYEERLEWAKRLNPENVWKRFAAELEVASAALERKHREGPPY
jgi:hypothetical protein